MAVDRPGGVAGRRGTHEAVVANTSGGVWQLQASLSGAYVHDLSFASPMLGFAAAELGEIWRTTDGGATWIEILNLGFPYEWYGIHAFNANDVLVGGFNDQDSNGIIRWSHDGGTTWSEDFVLSANVWAGRPRFASSTQGLMGSATASTFFLTSDGGAIASDWMAVDPVTDGSWFDPEFSLLPDQHAATSGIHYCASTDAGEQWTCQPSIDEIFDGGVFFVDDNHGWMGGGEISPNVEGWVHLTVDGGKTWTGRVLDVAYPIREVYFVSPSVGWAAGGNVFSGVGGIYTTSDGGQTWSLDLNTQGKEMAACDSQPSGDAYTVWCAGYDPDSTGAVYAAQGASTPAFLPSPQTYYSAQSVTLSASSPGASIHYTTDGSFPSVTSTLYTAPIAVSSTTTIQALAVAQGFAPSLLASAQYTIVPPSLQLSASVSSLSVEPGSGASLQLSIAGNTTIADVSFSCTGLPAGSSCAFSPATTSVNTSAQAVTLTINAAALSAEKPSGEFGQLSLGVLLLPGSLVAGASCARRRRTLNLFRIALLAGGVSLAGCGVSHETSVAAPQPIVATVTVQAAAPGAQPVMTQIQLTISA